MYIYMSLGNMRRGTTKSASKPCEILQASESSKAREGSRQVSKAAAKQSKAAFSLGLRRSLGRSLDMAGLPLPLSSVSLVVMAELCGLIEHESEYPCLPQLFFSLTLN